MQSASFKHKAMSLHNSINKTCESATEKRILETESLEKTILSEKNNKLLTKETTCGIWIFTGTFLQKFANKKAYVVLYGILGCVFGATSAYFNGTITTLEKRFKISSKTTGIITVGNDVSQLLVSIGLTYYAGKRHKPRWMAVGLYTVVVFCLMTALPHLLYGAGEDALLLTKEYGAAYDENLTLSIFDNQKRKTLCHTNDVMETQCEVSGTNYAPQIILFTAQVIAGIGGPLYYTLGLAYMDDNIQKSKTPALISISYFLKMLGPAIGYALASFCLKLYISPTLTPNITNNDPRWLGAWWLGWTILGLAIFILASLLALFPRTLPRAAARREFLKQAIEESASFEDMLKTFKRLLTNSTLMLNNFASVFYFLGYMPFWMFLPKYIESQYRQSASVSSLLTGTSILVFSAIGILTSGLIISTYKPRARYLAGWNVVVGAISVMGIASYAYLGCTENDNKTPLLANGELNPTQSCNINCGCDYVKYNPVCSEDGTTTFISACHAGCKQQEIVNGSKLYLDCSCIQQTFHAENIPSGGFAQPGSCPVDCLTKFYIFLVTVSFVKFSGATGRASNFLVTVRCVDQKDKPVAMAFGLTLMSLCAFVPSPIFYGIILDKTCLVWGQTCSGKGNCWLYNGETLRYTMNFTAAAFVSIGTLFDVGVWYSVKNLKIFDDDEVELEEL